MWNTPKNFFDFGTFHVKHSVQKWKMGAFCLILSSKGQKTGVFSVKIASGTLTYIKGTPWTLKKRLFWQENAPKSGFSGELHAHSFAQNGKKTESNPENCVSTLIFVLQSPFESLSDGIFNTISSKIWLRNFRFRWKTGSVVRWERFLTLFLTLFPGKNTPVSGKSTVNLRQFSPKTHYFSSYLHNLPYPKHFSTIQTILIPRIGSRKRRKKGSCAKKGYKNISQRSDPYMQTTCAGFLHDPLHLDLFHRKVPQGGKVCGKLRRFKLFHAAISKKMALCCVFFKDIPNAL